MHQAVQWADEVEQLLALGLTPRSRATTMPSRPLRPMPELKMFVKRRCESVLAQLAGKLEGHIYGRPAPAPPPPLPPPPKLVLTGPQPTVNMPPKPPPVVKPTAPATRPALRTTSRSAAAGPAASSKESRRLARLQALAATRPALAARFGNGNVASRNAPATTRPVVGLALVKPRIVQTPRPAVAPRPRPRLIQPGVSYVVRGIDTDRDSQISEDELLLAIRVFYYAVGGSNADKLSEDDIVRGIDRIYTLLEYSWIAPLPGSEPPAPPVDPTKPPRPAVAFARAILKAADTDGDGRLSLVEAMVGAKKWLRESDANHDGLLSSREFGEGMDRLVPRP
jgi:hypothetical protein